mmetsp:Transcript_20293/g.56367  ORF Transcript_20293/g.56367 Transcript_20293/m.56367 type:complete len:585 (+) Transcript_20293:35-1789(+)
MVAMAAAPRGTPLEPRRVQVGGKDLFGDDQDAPLFWLRTERAEMEVVLLSGENSAFPLTCGTFCVARLLRPIIFDAIFGNPGGAASFAVACAWLASIFGLLAAVLMRAPDLPDLTWLGARKCLERLLEPKRLALRLIAVALCFDVLHQFFALVCWDYFFSTGIAPLEEREAGSGTLLAIAFLLAVLHVVGLIGLIMMVVAYARGFRAEWRHQARSKARADVEAPQPKTNSCGGDPGHNGRTRGSVPTEPTSGGLLSSVAAAATAVAAAMAAAGGDGQGEAHATSVEGPRKAARPSGSRPPAPPGMSAADGGSGGRQDTGVGSGAGNGERVPSASSSASGADARRSGSGTPPRAWLWAGDEWLPVKIMRTGPEDFCTVRLPGGQVIQTRQSMLRPRDSDTEPEPPTPSFFEGRARSFSSRGAEAHGRSGHGGGTDSSRRTSSAEPPRKDWFGRAGSKEPQCGRDAGGRHAGGRPNSAEPTARERHARTTTHSAPERPRTAEGREASEGEKWAAERMERLRKELIELDRCSPGERKKGLRRLQRELHPDKQPPELRVFAQPLFHLVQREWEVDASRVREQAPVEGD